MFYAPKIWHLPHNKNGRDFITGDIHGAYNLLIQAMRRVNFDPKHDRIFCAGDLIDRGPESHRALGFLDQPYVYAVRGNHEDMLLQYYEDGEPDDKLLEIVSKRNGLDWWMSVDKGKRIKIINALRKLPLVMEVDTPRGPFAVLHADIPEGQTWSDFKEAVEAEDESTIMTALWGRNRVKYGSQELVQGIGRIFVGHTVQWDGLKRYGNIFAIDTGSVFAEIEYGKGHMTFVNAAMSTQLLNAAPKVEENIDCRDGVVPGYSFGDSFR